MFRIVEVVVHTLGHFPRRQGSPPFSWQDAVECFHGECHRNRSDDAGGASDKDVNWSCVHHSPSCKTGDRCVATAKRLMATHACAVIRRVAPMPINAQMVTSAP